MNTTMLIKLDKGLKERAQKIAKDLGLPMSTVINNYLRDFVVSKEVTFVNPILNSRSQKILTARLKEVREGKVAGPFKTVDAFMKSLNS